jgi:hypothetical protein
MNFGGPLARIAGPFALSGVVLACGHAYGQNTATPPTVGNTTTDSLEEVVVTGTAQSSGLKKLDASYSITTANQPEIRDVNLRNSRDVGPRFHSMSVQHFTACRPPVSDHVGPPFHGVSVQFMR